MNQHNDNPTLKGVLGVFALVALSILFAFFSPDPAPAGGPQPDYVLRSEYNTTSADTTTALNLRLKLDGTTPMTGNLRTGSYWLSSDGGNEGVWIGTTGKVGVGTNTPDTDIHLYQPNETVQHRAETGSATKSVIFALKTPTKTFWIYSQGADNSFTIQDVSSGVARIGIDTGGNVSITASRTQMIRGTTIDIWTEVTIADRGLTPLEDILGYAFTTQIAGSLNLTSLSGDAGMSCYVRGAAAAVYLQYETAGFEAEWGIASADNSINVISDGDGTYSILNNRGGERTISVHYQGAR